MPSGVYIRTPEMNAHRTKVRLGLLLPVQKETRICDSRCGCGQTFECPINSDQKFIHGHYSGTKENKDNQSKKMTGRNLGEENSSYGKPAWNRGLPAEQQPFYNKHHSEKSKEQISLNNVGQPNSEESKAKQSKTFAERGTNVGERNSHFGKPAAKGTGYGKGGKTAELGDIWFRSRWERNVARILNYLKMLWSYEPKAFKLTRKDRSKCTYRPDFDVEGVWWEVKGHMLPAAKEKIELFKEQYLEESFILVDKIKYKQLEDKYRKLIPNWEK